MPEFNLHDPRWRPFATQKLKSLAIYPNRLLHHADENIGALVATKSSKYDEYAVSAGGIAYLSKAYEEDRINGGYLVLLNNNKIMTTKEIADVAAMVSNVSPRDGQFGPYFWFNEDCTLNLPPGMQQEGSTLDEPPF